MAKRKLVHTTTGGREEFHFFAASLGAWRVDTNLDTLIASMKRDDMPFNIWLIPGSTTRDYAIDWCTPQVEDRVWIGTWTVPDTAI